MKHRHLNHSRFTLAAIDDIIGRGLWDDWTDLRAAARNDPGVLEGIERICAHYADDAYAQRFQFWRRYAQRKRAGLLPHPPPPASAGEEPPP